MNKTAKLEILMDALDAFNRTENKVLAESRLFDAALALDMPHDEPSVQEWAAVRVTRFLSEA